MKQLLIKEKASFAKTWKMYTFAGVFLREGSHDLQSADGRFTCCTGGAAKRLTPPPQIITAFSRRWLICGYGERRRRKSPGWHLTSNSFKAAQGTWRHFAAADRSLKWPQQWGRCSFTAYVEHTGTSLFHVCSHFFSRTFIMGYLCFSFRQKQRHTLFPVTLGCMKTSFWPLWLSKYES